MTDTVTRPVAEALPMRSVTIADEFWAPRRELVRTHMLPQQERQLRDGGQFEALRLGWRPGDANEPHIFWESDVAKWIEAASYSLATTPDPVLDAAVDEAIDLLRGAQQPDGYLNVYFTVVKPGQRFTDLRDAHELYCAGHLIEAGVAHYQATGKTSLLEIVRRYADLIHKEFGPGGVADGGYDGHQEIELALIRLADATGEERYRSLALRLIEQRGTQPFYFEQEAERRGTPGYFSTVFPHRPREALRFREYNQSHKPVREQSEAVGHSVRAVYMYSAMTDLAADTGEDHLRDVVERLWISTTERKMYLTGGLGSDPSIEGFGSDFDLSLDTAYAETCAAIGLVFWAQRMALMTGDGRYVDVLERALYNGVLSGASDDGTHYFYGNPMQSDGTIERNEWFGVACCPPNFARLIESLEYYAYAKRESTAIVNLYVSGSATFDLDHGQLRLDIESGAPWHGTTRIVVHCDQITESSVALRIPRWAGGNRVRVNGEDLNVPSSLGYVTVSRSWSDGDVIEVSLVVEPRRVWSRPEVRSTRGRVAIQRGPFVYCFEGVDNGGSIGQLSLPRHAALSESWDPERSLMRVQAAGFLATNDDAGLYGEAPRDTRPTRLTAVPYYSWANRGPSSMEIWIGETPAAE